MTNTHSAKGLVWIDLETPSEHEIAGLVQRYDLHPLVGEELRSSSSLAKIEFYPEYILAVLTIPVRVRKNGEYVIEDREVDFVIGKTFLITSRTDTIEELEYFAKIFETNSILDKGVHIEHAGHLFYYMIKRLYGGMNNDLENIRDAILTAESHIFKGDERRMVEVLSNLNRELIDFKQTARVHHEIWEEMVTHGDKSLFGESFDNYIRDIRDEFNRVHELIINARELLSDLRETNDSLLNTKQNEIIKVLTLLALIFNPLTFIASVFTIPAAHVPLIDKWYGWTVIVIIMIVLVAFCWWLFKKKRWI